MPEMDDPVFKIVIILRVMIDNYDPRQNSVYVEVILHLSSIFLSKRMKRQHDRNIQFKVNKTIRILINYKIFPNYNHPHTVSVLHQLFL